MFFGVLSIVWCGKVARVVFEKKRAIIVSFLLSNLLGSF